MVNEGSGRLARVLQCVLLIELLAYSYGACSKMQAGASVGAAIGAMVLIWFSIRAVANAYNFGMTWLVRTPRAAEYQLGLYGSIRLFCGELAAMLVVYSFLFPFERWLVPFAPTRDDIRGTPILLVPGFNCNRGYFWRFRRFLESRGLGPVYAVSLEPLLGSIDTNAEHLGLAVEEVCRQTGAERVILVGHSMGGLTARAYVHRYDGAQRVERIISLGSPHHGTVLAEGLKFAGENLRQMSRDSDWLLEFNQTESAPAPVPILAISTPHDDIVGPQASTTLDSRYARNLLMPGIGHLEMILSVPVMQAVADELNAPAQPRPPASS